MQVPIEPNQALSLDQDAFTGLQRRETLRRNLPRQLKVGGHDVVAGDYAVEEPMTVHLRGRESPGVSRLRSPHMRTWATTGSPKRAPSCASWPDDRALYKGSSRIHWFRPE
jgi:hypothetical protein